MNDIPGGMYLAQRSLNTVETIPNDAVHICIDKNQMAELVLRLTLGLQGMLPTETPMLFGYYSQEKNAYYFLNKAQHNHLKSLKDNRDIPCEE